MTTPVPVGKLLFNDNFTTVDRWGKTWANDWFTPSSKMNNVITDPHNVEIVDGKCQLTLRDTGHGALISTNPHGGIKPGFQFEYGYLEWCANVPLNAWAALWTDGQDWPENGEIDIVEVLNGGHLTSNYHSSRGSNNGPNTPMTPGYHVYAVHRQPGKNDIYWDNKLVRSYPTYDDGAPHYLIANIGAEGGEQTPGAVLLIDYVRVYAPHA